MDISISFLLVFWKSDKNAKNLLFHFVYLSLNY